MSKIGLITKGFLKESMASLLRFVQEIIEHGGIASQLLDTSLPVEFRIQSGLNHTQGNG